MPPLWIIIAFGVMASLFVIGIAITLFLRRYL
jgi:hypothetical protein